MAKSRTFGWVQNPSNTVTLRNIVSIFVVDSYFNTVMKEFRLPLLSAAGLFKDTKMYMEFQNMLRKPYNLPFEKLKGQGPGGLPRAQAKCSGLIQAAIDGQQSKEYVINGVKHRMKKPYSDDWTSDGFLRWAISLGFLDYDYEKDTCSISPLGKRFVEANSETEIATILGEAYLSYPPVTRVLGLLMEHQHMTKFEIGSQLGFTDEEGFTSIPQNIWVQAYEEETDPDEKSKLRSDVEGSSDKYARMICGWLAELGWVKKMPKDVVEHYGMKSYHCTINSAFIITLKGIQQYNRILGKSKEGSVAKLVYREMLASKAPNVEYLRTRRAFIIQYLSSRVQRSYTDIQKMLESKDIHEDIVVIKDDIQGLINIGLLIDTKTSFVKLNDAKIELRSSKVIHYETETPDAVKIKNRVRISLKYINHKYLTLIDYAFSGKDKCREFEIYTIDLLTNELNFVGKHLGGTRKPDGIFSYQDKGVIIDNKAYAKGFTITRSMADEMTRYVQENNERSPQRNNNCWWENFDDNVQKYNFVFISSLFKGNISSMLKNIKESTGVYGAVLNIENLLYFADDLKSGKESYGQFINLFGKNDEIRHSVGPQYVIEEKEEYSMAAEGLTRN